MPLITPCSAYINLAPSHEMHHILILAHRETKGISAGQFFWSVANLDANYFSKWIKRSDTHLWQQIELHQLLAGIQGVQRARASSWQYLSTGLQDLHQLTWCSSVQNRTRSGPSLLPSSSLIKLRPWGSSCDGIKERCMILCLSSPFFSFPFLSSSCAYDSFFSLSTSTGIFNSSA